MDRFIRIYDMRDNTLYETDDIELFVGDEPLGDRAFLEEAKSLVKAAATSVSEYRGKKKGSGKSSYGGGYGNPYYGGWNNYEGYGLDD
jgi:hypothetical protein